VEDNGPGVPQDLLANLFTPFTTSKHGLGLGLVISKDIVGEMGGRLEVSGSSPGKTAFTVFLRRVY
jgi:two-component system, NtrC family, C4-dicarboxylate transport sensor histidine kinase DctB